MIASINKGGQLKVEAITDEFVTLEKTHDVMARLDAQVEGDMDEGYSSRRHDANVNAPERVSAPGSSAASSAGVGKSKDGCAGNKKSGGKKRPAGGGGASAKKRRKAAPKN